MFDAELSLNSQDLESAKYDGFKLGVKLVRGAYLRKQTGVFGTKRQVDQAYDDALTFALPVPHAHTMLATHNAESLRLAREFPKKHILYGSIAWHGRGRRRRYCSNRLQIRPLRFALGAIAVPSSSTVGENGVDVSNSALANQISPHACISNKTSSDLPSFKSRDEFFHAIAIRPPPPLPLSAYEFILTFLDTATRISRARVLMVSRVGLWPTNLSSSLSRHIEAREKDGAVPTARVNWSTKSMSIAQTTCRTTTYSRATCGT